MVTVLGDGLAGDRGHLVGEPAQRHPRLWVEVFDGEDGEAG
jgi:hypothetical protein